MMAALPAALPPAAALLPLLLIAAASQLVAAQTVTSDLVGVYTKVNQSFVLDADCPNTISTGSIVFNQDADPSVDGTLFFNIRVPDTARSVSNRNCTSTGAMWAIESEHPAVTNKSQILNEWATAHDSPYTANLANSKLLADAASNPFIFGYEYTEVSCNFNYVRAGAAYLYYQPTVSITLTPTFTLAKKNKYLLMTFTNHNYTQGCIYIAAPGAVGGSVPKTDPGRSPSVIAKFKNGDVLNATVEPTILPTDLIPNPSTDSGLTGSVFGSGNKSETSLSKSCFPASATVRLDNGSATAMEHLQHGATVQSGVGTSGASAIFSDVFMFTHRDQHVMASFVTLLTSAGPAVSVSSGHYIYINGHLAAAKTAVVGDELSLDDGSSSQITSVQQETLRGLYNPQTLHGDLVVDGILVSTYTTAVEPIFAHSALLAPARALYRAKAGVILVGLFDSGASFLAGWLPGGPQVIH